MRLLRAPAIQVVVDAGVVLLRPLKQAMLIRPGRVGLVDRVEGERKHEYSTTEHGAQSNLGDLSGISTNRMVLVYMDVR